MLSPLEVVLKVVKALDSLGIRNMISGSFASGIHGIPRMTWDADIVADIDVRQGEKLAELLAGDFYVDVEAIKSAIEHRSSFNVIHLDSMFKVDIFPLRERPFDQAALNERQRLKLADSIPEEVFVASPEYTILNKLEWYQIGGQISDRQYRDVIGIIMVQAASGGLDWKKIRKWAKQLGLEALLEQARQDAEEGD